MATTSGLDRYTDGTWINVETPPGWPPGEMVQSLARDVDGSLWVGTYGHGLNHLRDGRFTLQPPRPISRLWGSGCDILLM